MKKTRILTVDDEHQTNSQVIEAISRIEQDDSRVYCRGGMLVGVIAAEDPGIPAGTLKIHLLSGPLLRERITQCCTLLSEKTLPSGDPGFVPGKPNKNTVEQILHRGHYDGVIRPLAGIVQAPTIRPDGSILQTPGYDAATCLIYKPLIDFPEVPESPTKQDVQEAIETLLEVVFDFPFVDESDKSVWVAKVLTMIARQCIEGCVPMFAVTANVRGSGKSLLSDCASLIAYGRTASRQAYSKSSEEMRKLITSVVLAADQSVLFDNIDTTIGGASLDAALTSTSWKDRILGQSKMTADMPVKTVWMATGNNLAYGSDIVRRVLPLRLNSLEENPEERSGFQHENLLAYVQRNRAILAIAALTIIRGYFAAGKPKQSGGQFGSFESWSDIIRGSLVWAGLADPLKTRVDAKASDESADALAMLISGLLEADLGNGLTAKNIADLVNKKDSSRVTMFGDNVTATNANKNPNAILIEAVSQLCGDNVTASKVAGQLRKFKGRIFKNAYMAYREGRGRVRKWYIETVNKGDDGDNGDNPTSHTRNWENMNIGMEGKQSHQRHHCHQEIICGCGEPMVPGEGSDPTWDCPGCGRFKPMEVSV